MVRRTLWATVEPHVVLDRAQEDVERALRVALDGLVRGRGGVRAMGRVRVKVRVRVRARAIGLGLGLGGSYG